MHTVDSPQPKCVLIGNESDGRKWRFQRWPPFGFFFGYAEGGGINVVGENPAFGSAVVTATITDTTLIGNQALGGASSSGLADSPTAVESTQTTCDAQSRGQLAVGNTCRPVAKAVPAATADMPLAGESTSKNSPPPT